ncbi:hypothetical protein ACFQ10_54230 [Streptomyces indonesiensis]|uniref:VMAP-C domain-containing protein n=1 Tax=Streptomyces violaceusniger group TaxID=2839105 RepID=UPI003558EE80
MAPACDRLPPLEPPRPAARARPAARRGRRGPGQPALRRSPRTQGRSAAGPDLATGRHPEGSSDALTVWRAGIPVVAWDGRTIRDPDFVQQLRQKQADASGHLARLREAATELRLEPIRSAPLKGKSHLGQHVVLVWDDPTRPVEPQGRMTGPDEGVGGR